MVQLSAHPPLRRLEPLQLLPDQYSDRSRALTLLRQIDCIEIRDAVKRSGARHYVVDIYYRLPTHGIPTNHTKRSRHRAAPDARVLRRFSEFTNVCDEMYFHTHAGHESSAPCVFCGASTNYVTASPTQPRLMMKLLLCEEQIRRRLEHFLNDVVRMTVSGVKAYGGRNCLGQEHVPLLLLEFLLPQEASPLGAAAAEMSVQALRTAMEVHERAAMLNASSCSQI